MSLVVFPLLEQAIEAGEPEAMYSLGLFYLEGNGVEQDVSRCFLAGAGYLEAGSSKAMFFLGLRTTGQGYR